jgi:hypothetical protein
MPTQIDATTFTLTGVTRRRIRIIVAPVIAIAVIASAVASGFAASAVVLVGPAPALALAQRSPRAPPRKSSLRGAGGEALTRVCAEDATRGPYFGFNYLPMPRGEQAKSGDG